MADLATIILAMAQAFGSVLWTFAGIVAAAIVLWALWQILQIGRDFRFYLRDFVAFKRGKIKKAADIKDIELIIEEPRAVSQSEFDRILEEEEKPPKEKKPPKS